MKICPNCNEQINEEYAYCTNCGYSFTVKKENSSKQIKAIIIAIIVAAVILAVGKYVYNYLARADYKYKVQKGAYTMIEGAADAEDACNMIVSVWNNSIWKKEDFKTDKYTIDSSTGEFYDDFNDSLDNLFDDSSFISDLRGINDNLGEVNKMMKELQNPPKGCEQLHEAFMDVYDEYYELVNCALDPSGNLESYSDNFSEADEMCAKYYDKLQVYFD